MILGPYLPGIYSAVLPTISYPSAILYTERSFFYFNATGDKNELGSLDKTRKTTSINE